MNENVKVAFKPIWGEKAKIDNIPIHPGNVYFVTDDGKILLDTKDNQRISVGSSGGSAILYATAYNLEEDVDGFYTIFKNDLNVIENTHNIKENDLIINLADNAFYRIVLIKEDSFICQQLAISGGGGSGGAGYYKPEVQVSPDRQPNLINGQQGRLKFTIISAKNSEGNPVENNFFLITLHSVAVINGIQKQAKRDPIQWKVPEGYDGKVEVDLDITDLLFESANTTVYLQVESDNHDLPYISKSGFTYTCAELKLEIPYDYHTVNKKTGGRVDVAVNVYGVINRAVRFYLDGQFIHQETRKAESEGVTSKIERISYQIPKEKFPNGKTHGSHKIGIRLFQMLANGEFGVEAEPIEFEIGAVDDENDITQPPIIWFGDFKDEYYSYDKIRIPVMAFNPGQKNKAVVTLSRNGIKVGEREITNAEEFLYWEIVDAEINTVNNYTFTCRNTANVQELKTSRDIKIKVVKDPNRDMELARKDNLILNFSPKGRSNNESVSNRQVWKYTDKLGQTRQAQFLNFNWENNGWKTDEVTKDTYLKISNGAEFRIPLPKLEYGGNNKYSNSIELSFKLTNISKYGKLIKNLTRYKYKDGTSSEYKKDDEWYEAFLAQINKPDGFDNYDNYLQSTIDPDVYDSLEYDMVQKIIDTKSIICSLASLLRDKDGNVIEVRNGMCVGPEDSFFSNGTNTVNVSFVEEELVNLSFVYNADLKLIFIYINGVITGVVKDTSANSSFTISNENNEAEIIFKSDYCDIDLYGFRVYNNKLEVADIVNNYGVDKLDIEIFDQVNMTYLNNALNEHQLLFNQFVNWPETHDYVDCMMPYIIFDGSNSSDEQGRLPYSKTTPINCGIEFVNAPLEKAYTSGRLENIVRAEEKIPEGATQEFVNERVKNYYKHHCPSWTSTLQTDDRVEMSVQGTSSQFYPRRNFKAKTKMKTDVYTRNEDGTYTKKPKQEKLCNIYMNRGPYKDDYSDDKKAIVIDGEKDKIGKEKSRMKDGWYFNNNTNATDRWTLKVDYMESSGSYNAGFASMVDVTYSKHPLQDYLDYISDPDNKLPSTANEWLDYRTSMLGYPVMAFHRLPDEAGTLVFIGFYRMLYDKGSEEVFGFKTKKGIESKLLTDDSGEAMSMSDVAECWEFATNNRTFCSFRDPWGRVELSFSSPENETTNIMTADGAPIVMNNFEYRYSRYEDALDIMMNYKGITADDVNELNETYGANITQPSLDDKGNVDIDSFKQAEKFTTSMYKNWEEACKWVYSTNTNDVYSQYIYEKAEDVGEALYESGKYYYYNDNGELVLDDSDEMTVGRNYFIIKTTIDANGQSASTTSKMHLTNKIENVISVENALVYRYYYASKDLYQLNKDPFNGEREYYRAKSDENYQNKCNILVKPATGNYNNNTQYYTYNKDAKVATNNVLATAPVISPTLEDFNAGKYYIAAPKVFDGIEYTHDTKEYRVAKFTQEFADYFDPEYTAVYFIMTEVFECYDSRGKNCMMASWGPRGRNEDGTLKNYIWYPIFYDIDTQLGINNTGIPSFEFNVDATDNNNYSTSDSLLWNNFYKIFKNKYIIPKYAQLKGTQQNVFGKLRHGDAQGAILNDVNKIEKWYKFDKDVTNNIACEGMRPLIATNLDMYYKYITINNPKAPEMGVAALNDNGVYRYPIGSTPPNSSIKTEEMDGFFYALQGDRSQSRRQFLTNRIEYTDSWLNQGNYKRGGDNRIRGRLSANDMTHNFSSDWWNDGLDNYWVDGIEFGEKTHKLDSEYWLNLKPIHSMYVTAGEDSANYPSQKYDGKTVKPFALRELETGIKSSPNYREQLIYIYGANKMSDFGDLSKLYFVEFFLEGNFSKLTRLKLGSNETDIFNETEVVEWKNQMNSAKLVALPLLQEADFTNINFQQPMAINLAESYKLRDFRSIGVNNVESIKFADGAPLERVYYPYEVKDLELISPSALTHLITEEEAIVDGRILPGDSPIKGLYIDGFLSNTRQSNLNSLHLKGSALKYDSYQIMKRIHEIVSTGRKSEFSFTLENIDWSPYIKLSVGDIYDSNKTYVIDDGHYGFIPYIFIDVAKFNIDVANGGVYVLNDDINDSRLKGITYKEFYKMLKEFVDESYSGKFKQFGGTSDSKPLITGSVYVMSSEEDQPLDPDDIVDEDEINTLLTNYYQDLDVHFTKVHNKANTAKFIIQNADGTTEYVNLKNGSAAPSIQKIKYVEEGQLFQNPYDIYKVEKEHYDFIAWSISPDIDDKASYIIGGENAEGLNWSDVGKILNQDDKRNLTFYAIVVLHKYPCTFYNKDQNGEYEIVGISYATINELVIPPKAIPYNYDEINLPLEERYRFLGYSSSTDAQDLVVFEDEELGYRCTGENNINFYAVYNKENVYDNPTDIKYFTIVREDGKNVIYFNPNYNLAGKVTLPLSFANTQGVKQQIDSIGGYGQSYTGQKSITHVFFEKETSVNKNNYTVIKADAFRTAISLIYFDFESIKNTLLTIGTRAFFDCNLINRIIYCNYIISYNSFNSGFGKIPIGLPNNNTLKLIGNFEEIGNMAFAYINGYDSKLITDIIVGDSKIPNKTVVIQNDAFTTSSGGEIENLTVYTANQQTRTAWENAQTYLSSTFNNISIMG